MYSIYLGVGKNNFSSKRLPRVTSVRKTRPCPGFNMASEWKWKKIKMTWGHRSTQCKTGTILKRQEKVRAEGIADQITHTECWLVYRNNGTSTICQNRLIRFFFFKALSFGPGVLTDLGHEHIIWRDRSASLKFINKTRHYFEKSSTYWREFANSRKVIVLLLLFLHGNCTG